LLCAGLLAIALMAQAACGGGGDADTDAVALKLPDQAFTQGNIRQRIAFYGDYYGMSQEVLASDAEVYNRMVDDIVTEYANAWIVRDRAEAEGLLPLTEEETA